MIPRDYITEWRAHAPWVQDFQVEQDLVISRALIRNVLYYSNAKKQCKIIQGNLNGKNIKW